MQGKQYTGIPHMRFVVDVGAPKRSWHFALLRVAMLFVSAALALDAHSTVVNQVLNGTNNLGLSDPSLWGEDPDPTNDYVAVKSSLYVSSSQSKNTFAGKSLKIGVVGGASPAVLNYASGTSSAKIANITGPTGIEKCAIIAQTVYMHKKQARICASIQNNSILRYFFKKLLQLTRY